MYTTIKEFLNSYKFYHVTCHENHNSILKNGLLSSCGIYATRTNDIEVLKSIYEQYIISKCLIDNYNYRALVVEIDPKKLDIKKEEIRIDHATNSNTLKAQNIIMRNHIQINNDNLELIEWAGLSDPITINSEMRNHPDKLQLFNPSTKMFEYIEGMDNGILVSKWQEL
ncbi:hypothetical protein [Algoriphagus sp.]|uniref:hypothetical protein n=1 Tax=Algoriphagus sp. TaxID=1872435 RepID=UPI003F6F9921